jgi:hypothetical protein
MFFACHELWGGERAEREQPSDGESIAKRTDPQTTELVNGRPRIRAYIPPMVDTEIEFFEGGDGNGEHDENAAMKNRATSGAKKSQSKTTTFYDDKAKKLKRPDESESPSSEEGPGGASGGRGADSQEHAEWWEHWYPVCMFIDPAGGGDPNGAVKGLVDAGAECQVNIVVFPVTISSGYPSDPKMINRYAKNWCNIQDAGIGATRASATTCVHHNNSADLMCGNLPPNPPTVAGCAEKRGYPEEQADLDRLTKQHVSLDKSDGSTGGQQDGVLASIEDAGSCISYTVNHEVTGHSAIGWPNGNGAGFGIQNMKNPKAPDPGNRWDISDACAQLRKQSHTGNNGRFKYQRNRQTYYIESKEPINLLSGGKLFGDPSPPPVNPPKILANNGAPQENVFSDDFFENNKTKDPDAPKSQDATAGTIPEKHKKLLSMIADEGKLSGKQKRLSSKTPPLKTGAKAKIPPSESGKQFTATLLMDEGAGKKFSAQSSSASYNTYDDYDAYNGYGSSDRQSVFYDEGAPKGDLGTSLRNGGNRKEWEYGVGSSKRDMASYPGAYNKLISSKSAGRNNLDPDFFKKKSYGKIPKLRMKGSGLRRAGPERGGE